MTITVGTTMALANCQMYASNSSKCICLYLFSQRTKSNMVQLLFGSRKVQTVFLDDEFISL